MAKRRKKNPEQELLDFVAKSGEPTNIPSAAEPELAQAVQVLSDLLERDLSQYDPELDAYARRLRSVGYRGPTNLEVTNPRVFKSTPGSELLEDLLRGSDIKAKESDAMSKLYALKGEAYNTNSLRHMGSQVQGSARKRLEERLRRIAQGFEHEVPTEPLPPSLKPNLMPGDFVPKNARETFIRDEASSARRLMGSAGGTSGVPLDMPSTPFVPETPSALTESSVPETGPSVKENPFGRRTAASRLRELAGEVPPSTPYEGKAGTLRMRLGSLLEEEGINTRRGLLEADMVAPLDKKMRRMANNAKLKRLGRFKSLGRGAFHASWILPLAIELGSVVKGAIKDNFNVGSKFFDGVTALDEFLESEKKASRIQKREAERKAKAEMLRSQNLKIMKSLAPHLAASLEAGMELPEDAVMVGGRPRMDLLNSVVDSMSSGSF